MGRAAWSPFEVVMCGVEDAPQDHRTLRRGTTKYPFDQLELGHAMRVRRSLGAVREAVRRYVKGAGEGRVFTVRRDGAGYVKVRRAK